MAHIIKAISMMIKLTEKELCITIKTNQLMTDSGWMSSSTDMASSTINSPNN